MISLCCLVQLTDCTPQWYKRSFLYDQHRSAWDYPLIGWFSIDEKSQSKWTGFFPCSLSVYIRAKVFLAGLIVGIVIISSCAMLRQQKGSVGGIVPICWFCLQIIHMVHRGLETAF